MYIRHLPVDFALFNNPTHSTLPFSSTKDMIMMRTRLERISTTSTRWKQNTFLNLIIPFFFLFSHFLSLVKHSRKKRKNTSRQQCYDTLLDDCTTHQLRDDCCQHISLHCNLASPKLSISPFVKYPKLLEKGWRSVFAFSSRPGSVTAHHRGGLALFIWSPPPISPHITVYIFIQIIFDSRFTEIPSACIFQRRATVFRAARLLNFVDKSLYVLLHRIHWKTVTSVQEYRTSIPMGNKTINKNLSIHVSRSIINQMLER